MNKSNNNKRRRSKMRFRRQFRNSAIILILLLVLSLLISPLLFKWLLPEFSNEQGKNIFLIIFIVLVYFILCVAGFIIYGFIRLQSDYAAGKPGSSFQRRLLFTIIFIAIIPLFIITLFSEFSMRRSINSVINERYIKIENLLVNIEDIIIGFVKQDIVNTIQRLRADPIFINTAFLGNTRNVSQFAIRNDLDYIGIYTSTLKPLAQYYRSQKLRLSYSNVAQPIAITVKHINKEIFVTNARGYEVDYMQAFAAIGHPNTMGYIVIAKTFPANISYIGRENAESRQALNQLKYLRQPLLGSTLLLMISVMLVTMLLAMLISYLFSKMLAAPIQELAVATKRVAAGDLTYVIKYKPRDELKQLVNSFNKMTNELNASKQALIHSERIAAWSEIGRRIAHEIKNPLTPIKLSAERIRKKYTGTDEEYKKVLLSGINTIVEEVDNLKSLVDEFSEFARMPQLQLKVCDINTIVRATLKIFDGISEGITIKTDLAGELPLLNLDKKQINQVIINLINNAIDAVNGNGTITISTYKENTMFGTFVYLKITDTGIGIDADTLSKIYNPYFSMKKNGTGLGLSIVEKIITEHHSKITCESEIKKGTTFTIEFPV